MSAFTIHHANPSDLDTLLDICKRYHQFEELALPDFHRRKAVEALLKDKTLGFILTARSNVSTVGYIAICLGYSIELGGRDAYIDEFFIDESWRGQGIGSSLLDAAIETLTTFNAIALHMEVAHQNQVAKAFYSSRGFTARNRYSLMTKVLHKDKAERADAPNSHACGTFGTSPAEQALVPKASRSR